MCIFTIEMNALVVSYVLLASALLASGADESNNQSLQINAEDDPRFDARVSDSLAKNVLQLAQEIGTTLLQDSDKQTEVFSPLSIYTALSVLLMGANGQTFQELKSLMKINNGKLNQTIQSIFFTFFEKNIHNFRSVFVRKYMEGA